MALIVRSFCSIKNGLSACREIRPAFRKPSKARCSTAAAAAQPERAELRMPQADGAPKQYDPKIKKIVDEIARLSLYEVSELNSLLKETLNIKDAPMMAMGAMPLAAAAPAEDDDEEPQSTKTSFTIKLLKCEDGHRVPLIKEIKSLIEGLNLVQAKKFVETLPQVVRSNVGKSEAEEIVAKLKAVGGTCEID